jgi:hypothetical protein
MKSILIVTTFLTLFLFQTESLYIVTLGKAPNCNGFNFCGIIENTGATTIENEVLATIHVIDEKHIQFSFLKRSVNDRIFLKYFSTGTFLLDDDYVFSEDICTAINTTKCTLKKGKYQLQDEYDKYVVVFNY